MSVIKAKNFLLRSELEDYIRAEFVGSNIPGDHTIEGTFEELKNLQLSDKSMVFGIKCVITDTKNSTKVKLEEKLKRVK